MAAPTGLASSSIMSAQIDVAIRFALLSRGRTNCYSRQDMVLLILYGKFIGIRSESEDGRLEISDTSSTQK